MHEIQNLSLSGFVLVESGTDCNHIMTIEDCERAAVALRLFDTTPEEDSVHSGGGWDQDPPYCYNWISGSTHVLRFNVGTNTGDCYSYDQCLCYA